MKNIIDDLYDSERSSEYADFMTVKITLRCTAESAALFNVISNRFGISRFSLLEGELNSIANHFFFRLNDVDRGKLAELADLEATELLSKQGVEITDGENPVPIRHWFVIHERMLAAENDKKE